MSDSNASKPGLAGEGRVSLSDEVGVHKTLVQVVFGLWDIVNSLTRLQPSKRERYRVTIFGSARAMPGHAVYEEVKRMSAGLAALGCDIVTGGGPGLMMAANEGAEQARARGQVDSFGIRVQLPFEQEPNPYVGQAFQHQTFFTRLHHFVLASDAFIVAPGGIGTALEALMIWQLRQVGQLDTPLIFAGPMWRGFVDWARRSMLRPDFALATPDDLSIPECTDNADEAVALIGEYQRTWRST